MFRFWIPAITIALSSLVVVHVRPHIKESKSSYYIYYVFLFVIIAVILFMLGFEIGRILIN